MQSFRAPHAAAVPAAVTGRKVLPQQDFEGESEVLFDSFSFKKKNQRRS